MNTIATPTIVLNSDSSFTFTNNGTYVVEVKLNSDYINSGSPHGGNCRVRLQYLVGSKWFTYLESQTNPYQGWTINTEIEAQYMLSTSYVNSNCWRVALYLDSPLSTITFTTALQWSRMHVYQVDISGANYGSFFMNKNSYSGNVFTPLPWTPILAIGITVANGNITFASDGVYALEIQLDSDFTSGSSTRCQLNLEYYLPVCRQLVEDIRVCGVSASRWILQSSI